MNIDIDKYGNVLRSATISYGRKTKDADLTVAEQAEQDKINIIYTENDFTVKDSTHQIIDDANDYHLPVLWQTKNYELTGFEPGTDNYFSIDEITTCFPAANTDYESKPAAGKQIV